MSPMTLYNGADASRPGQPLPPLTDILFGYVGAADLPGPPDTPYVWTLADWNLYLDPASHLYGGPQLRPCPIYTHDYPGNPADDAENAVDACLDLGWAPARGRLIFWDAEQLVDEQYAFELNQEIRVRGFRLGKYGELVTVNQDPPVDGGTWFAAWQKNKPSLVPPGQGVAWQWASPGQVGGAWDLTIATGFVYANCGRSIRKLEP